MQLASNRPLLLVSVRNVEEARAAGAGGCDLLDVKEPERGPLGAADMTTIRAIASFAAAPCDHEPIPCSIAIGELTDFRAGYCGDPLDRIWAVKLGPRGIATIAEWIERWRCCTPHLVSRFGEARRIAVAYADHRAAQSPPPCDIARAARDAGCTGLLIDTFLKDGRSLFDHATSNCLKELVGIARQSDLPLALAGSLREEHLPRLADLRPAIVAVRGAACDQNDRRSSISRVRVAELQLALTNQRVASDSSSTRS